MRLRFSSERRRRRFRSRTRTGFFGIWVRPRSWRLNVCPSWQSGRGCPYEPGSNSSATPDDSAWVSAEIELKYSGYLAREKEAAAKLAELASFRLPADTPYHELITLSTEARQKLGVVRPPSLAQAARIPGVSP